MSQNLGEFMTKESWEAASQLADCLFRKNRSARSLFTKVLPAVPDESDRSPEGSL